MYLKYDLNIKFIIKKIFTMERIETKNQIVHDKKNVIVKFYKMFVYLPLLHITSFGLIFLIVMQMFQFLIYKI